MSAELHQAAQFRLVRHYIRKLRLANQAFLKGSEGVRLGLSAFEAELSQVEYWQSWLAEHMQSDTQVSALYSDLVNAAGDLLALRVSLNQNQTWHETGLVAARHTGDQAAELMHLLKLGYTHSFSGQFDCAIDYLQRCQELADRVGNRPLLAQALERLSRIHSETGDLVSSDAEARASLEIYRQLGDEKGVAGVLAALGYNSILKGDWGAGESFLAEAIALFTRFGDLSALADSLRIQSIVMRSLGRLAEARRCSEQALSILELIDNQPARIMALQQLAVVSDTEGDFASGTRYHLQSLEVARRIGRDGVVDQILHNLGYSSVLQGNFADARRYLQAALEGLRKRGQMLWVASTLANIIQAYIHFQQFTEAEMALREGISIVLEQNSSVDKFGMLVAAIHLRLATNPSSTDPIHWAGLILKHPEAEHDNRVEVEKLRPQWEAAFGADRVRILLEEGQYLDLNTVLQENITRFDPATPT